MVDVPKFTDPELSPEEFAAQWGADPMYVKAPNLPGDGYLFYNFSVEQNDPQFLREFVPAIQRTIQFATQAGYTEEDQEDLEDFLSYVQTLLKEKDHAIHSSAR